MNNLVIKKVILICSFGFCFLLGCATPNSAYPHQPNLEEGPDHCKGPHLKWVCEGSGANRICGCVVKPSYQTGPYNPTNPPPITNPQTPLPSIMGGQ